MKKNATDNHGRKLLCEFLKYGLLIFIWICFLTYRIMWITSNPLRYGSAVWLTFFSFAVLIILVAIAGVELYRRFTSYIRWYQGIFDSIPMSVIATDKDATWRQANEMARKTVNIKQGQNIEELNSRSLIDADGNVTKRMWIQGATEYRITGNRLCVGGEDVGHILLFYNMSELTGTNGTRTELIDDINRLLGQLSATTASFDGCASSLAGCTAQQAGIICELSDVIVGIASGTINEPDELNEKMGIVKAQMQWQVENNQLQIDNIRKAVGELAATHDSINGVLRSIDRVP